MLTFAMSFNIRNKPYNLFEVYKDGDTTTKQLVGVALPFSGQNYGFTLLFDNELKLVMYPAKDYSRSHKKFDIMSVNDIGKTKERTKVGEGWRSRYGSGFNMSVSYAGIEMKLQLLPK